MLVPEVARELGLELGGIRDDDGALARPTDHVGLLLEELHELLGEGVAEAPL